MLCRSLADKTTIVTGGGTGIGRAVDYGLAQAGCRVAIVGRRQTALDEAAAGYTGSGAIGTFAADVAQRDDVDRLFRWAADELGADAFARLTNGRQIKQVKSRVNGFGRFFEHCRLIEPRVRHLGDADIGLGRSERMGSGDRVQARQGVENRRFADVGESKKTDACHESGKGSGLEQPLHREARPFRQSPLATSGPRRTLIQSQWKQPYTTLV